ncbi:MAG: GTP cyclohydrolase I FolE [Anaerolineae bacterium]|nr:GTP cyclohydrolase I FolE [Anaerolineae bacterium]
MALPIEVVKSGNGHRTNGNGNGNGHAHLHIHESEAAHVHTHDPELKHELIVKGLNTTVVDNLEKIEDAVRTILEEVGEDPDRDGLVKTPYRVAKMYGELLEGYTQDAEEVINGAMFDVDYGEGEMVVVADIEYNSLCEHHMLPFVGKAHVAYIPRNKVVGLSKIPRLVDMFAHRLQVQERLTNEIADVLEEYLDPVGVIVMIEGQHMCGSLRGVKKHGVNMVTTAKRGEFRTNRDLRDEFFKLIGK